MNSRFRVINIDLSGIVGCICLFGLIILCVGEPDLLDAIVAWIGRQP